MGRCWYGFVVFAWERKLGKHKLNTMLNTLFTLPCPGLEPQQPRTSEAIHNALVVNSYHLKQQQCT